MQEKVLLFPLLVQPTAEAVAVVFRFHSITIQPPSGSFHSRCHSLITSRWSRLQPTNHATFQSTKISPTTPHRSTHKGTIPTVRHVIITRTFFLSCLLINKRMTHRNWHRAHSWYHGSITRRDAEFRLKPSPAGTFLIRDSLDSHYHYFLAAR